MAIFEGVIYKSPVLSLARWDLQHIQILAGQNWHKRKNVSNRVLQTASLTVRAADEKVDTASEEEAEKDSLGCLLRKRAPESISFNLTIGYLMLKPSL